MFRNNTAKAMALPERQFKGSAAQVLEQHEQVVRVDEGLFRRALKK
ncbi:MAG: hypothetical protein HS126_05890 [Anaerolineales bacterium]|nr:hypothetical protein [Anaerolineales bacterium]